MQVRKTPLFLFHGTPLKDLEELRPISGGALYASDDIRLSATFLADPEHCVCVRSSRGAVHAFIGECRADFIRRDRGGTIYLVDARCFSPSPQGVSLRMVWEWTTTQVVTPIARMNYASALTAMLALGVRVHFVPRAVCENVRGADDVRPLLYSVPCENIRFEQYLYQSVLPSRQGPTSSPAASPAAVD